MNRVAPYLIALSFVAFACGDDDGGVDASLPDSSMPDVASLIDAGPDSGPNLTDAGNDVGPMDAGTMDAGNDAGPDAGPEEDTYANYAMSFMDMYCTECHGAGSRTRDYTSIDDIRRDMVGIRCGVTAVPLDDCSGFPPPNQFPVGDGPKPNDEERGRLVAWIEAGLP